MINTNDILKKYKSKILYLKNNCQNLELNFVLLKIHEILIYMNRFRNVNLQIYFDEEINKIIKKITHKKIVISQRNKKKKKIKICYLLSKLNDIGGASIVKRFVLDDYIHKDISIEFSFIIVPLLVVKHNSNLVDKFKKTSEYKYIKKQNKIQIIDPNLNFAEKSQYLGKLLKQNKIDVCIHDQNIISMYALSKFKVSLTACLTQDCYTYTLGPGFSDISFYVTNNQFLEYKFNRPKKNFYEKVVYLPLPNKKYISSSKPIQLKKLNISKKATISATSNLWKCFFGESDIFIRAIHKLINKNRDHHHIFIGSRRCLDNLEVYLNQNPEIKNNIHFIGTVKNIYSLLKKINFWINSYPTSGGTNIEAAAVGVPSIEWICNRNLTLHPLEFLSSPENIVTNEKEFIELGTKFINNYEFRKKLGNELKRRVHFDYDQNKIVKNRIIQPILDLYKNKNYYGKFLDNKAVKNDLFYEKNIAYYPQIKEFNKKIEYLKKLILNFPTKNYAYIKFLYEYISFKKKFNFKLFFRKLNNKQQNDYRIMVLISYYFYINEDYINAMKFINKSCKNNIFDLSPLKLKYLILMKQNKVHEATKYLKKTKLSQKVDLNKISLELNYYDY